MRCISNLKPAALIGALAVLLLPKSIFAQAELMPYGNLNGIRIKGELMEFKTSIGVAGQSWAWMKFTAKERQKPRYSRTGNLQTVNTIIDSLYFTETVEDKSTGGIKVTVKCSPHADTLLNGVYFTVDLPEKDYTASQIKLTDAKAQLLDTVDRSEKGEYLRQFVRAVHFKNAGRSFSIKTDSASLVIIQSSPGSANHGIRMYFPVRTGFFRKGEVYEKTFELRATGPVDHTAAVMEMDTTRQGRLFAGFGGNFRLQNTKTDPEVIDYCLKNMRVAWGRVEMPWKMWQPDMDTDPSAATDRGSLNPHVKASMEMAQRLGKMNIPVILTAWAPPAWAVVGTPRFAPENGVWGNPLNYEHIEQIYKSIADYILYLKDHYGVEVKYFSFNESDLGINIRQTGEEHDQLIKGLGAYFETKGLKTKLLLGDNSDATTYKFIYPAMNDSEARPFMGAVSFHSWRGWDTPTLEHWYNAAKQLNLPLIVGEGSIDAAAWGYPAYFQEESYALEEINLYIRLLSICQPISILQWQLTADYSPLIGGGIFGTDGPLRPTQRFWNLKQLASTPKDVFNFPLTVDRPDISGAALGNPSTHTYTLHIVNNGAARTVTIKGLPASVKSFSVYVTDKRQDMKEKAVIKVNNHQLVFKLTKRCYTTLVNE